MSKSPPKRKADTSAWNRKHPEQVRAAQLRYYEREQARRAKLSKYMRAKEDVGKIFTKLSPRDRTRIMAWLRKAEF